MLTRKTDNPPPLRPECPLLLSNLFCQPLPEPRLGAGAVIGTVRLPARIDCRRTRFDLIDKLGLMYSSHTLARSLLVPVVSSPLAKLIPTSPLT